MDDRLRFHPQFPEDLAAAIRWYDEIAAGLADRFRDAVNEGLGSVSEMPASFPIAFDDVRFARIRRFPYLLLFREDDQHVRFVGMFHTSTNPERWRSRVE